MATGLLLLMKMALKAEKLIHDPEVGIFDGEIVMLEYEKKKQSLLIESLQVGDYMYQLGQELKDKKAINVEVTYQLTLPKNPGEKAYFVRK